MDCYLRTAIIPSLGYPLAQTQNLWLEPTLDHLMVRRDVPVLRISVGRFSSFLATSIVLLGATAARAQCATSSDGLTRTCTGDIQTHQSFNHLDGDTAPSYSFTFKSLTSDGATSSSYNVFEMLSSGAFVGGKSPGVDGATLTFRFNLDQAATDFDIHAFNHVATVVQSTGGVGGTPSETKGSGDRRGSAGGAGGSGGVVQATIADAHLTGLATALQVESLGGDGGTGQEGYSTEFGDGVGGNGGQGGAGGTVAVDLTSIEYLTNSAGPGAVALFSSQGGKGGTGAEGRSVDYTAQGGVGGTGGKGGIVKASFFEALTVNSTDGTGLQLISIGGHGGSGGYAENLGGAGSVRAGAGGTGGSGTSVTFESGDDSLLSATVANGSGVLLQSYGGEGGQGGEAQASGAVGANAGGGGAGGTAGSVLFSLDANDLSVKSTGSGAFGISGQSVGGAGGAGGARKTSGNGGTGGAGGDSGQVSLQLNGAESATAMIDAAEIAVRGVSRGGNGGAGSVGGSFYDGGGGGNGGDGKSVFAGVGGTATVSGTQAVWLQSLGGIGGAAANGGNRGGQGGTGGDAGTVHLDYDGSAATKGAWNVTAIGDASYGFFLTSVGGAGGNGGSTTNSNSNPAGGGGDGGTIYASWGVSRFITMNGENATGFYGKSAGGAGGRGGGSEGAGAGGSAGPAGTGGNLEIGGSWQIYATGANSHGISLLSSGGAGGTGGESSAISFKGSRSGANGGTAGLVNLNFDGPDSTITMEASGSTGVYALSQGGDGGAAGRIGSGGSNVAPGPSGGKGGGFTGDVYATTDATTTIESTAIGLMLESRGGNGGEGNNDPAEGYGGPGGAGGTAANLIFNLSASGAASTGDWSVTTSDENSAGLKFESSGGNGGAAGNSNQSGGGTGGNGGNGGGVTLHTGTQTVTVTGANSKAVYVTTAGGDGSQGGTMLNNTEKGTGGWGGDGGAGGMVTLDGSWSIDGSSTTNTQGFSVATTGGDGGDGGETVFGDASGGDGGAGGAGGGIEVLGTLIVSTMQTTGVGASFTSTGGAGGAGGAQQSSTGDPVGGPGGNGGNGGAIEIAGQWSIETTGDTSHGIQAISQGGDGGAKGAGGNQANGTGGSAGKVEVDVSGPAEWWMIRTHGAGAHGIVAQANSGARATTSTSTETLVEVTVGGDIITSGVGSFGVSAGSSGASRGAVEVTVASGASVSGGAVSTTGGTDGAGIYIQNGTSNELVNNGSLTSASGADGYAVIYAGSGSLDVENNGSLTGSVKNAQVETDLGGRITLTNRADGLIDAGPILEMVHLQNHGTVKVGGDGRIGATTLSGNLRQASPGTLSFNFDPSRGADGQRADWMAVAGWAWLDGQVQLTPIAGWQADAGRQSVTLLEAAGGLTRDDGLAIIPSAAGQYRLEPAWGNSLVVSYDIDFANSSILGATNSNQDRVARHLDQIYRAGALRDEFALPLLAVETTKSYANAMNALGAELVIDNQIVSVKSAVHFANSLISCTSQDGARRYFDDGQCAYFTFTGSHYDFNESTDNLGFSASSWGLAAGFEREFATDWSLSGALSYQDVSLSVDGISASSEGAQVFAGLSLKRRFDAIVLSGSVNVGYGSFDMSRELFHGEKVDGRQEQWSAGAELHAAYLIDHGDWYLKPRVGLGVQYAANSDFTESGSSGLRLDIDSNSETYWYLQPTLEFGGEFEAGAGLTVRPRLAAGITQYLGDFGPETTARFVDAPDGVPDFTARTALASTQFNLSAAVDVVARNGITVRAKALRHFSSKESGYGASLRLEIPF